MTQYILIALDMSMPSEPYILNAASYSDRVQAQRIAVARAEEYIDEEVTADAEDGEPISEFQIEESEHGVTVYRVVNDVKYWVLDISIQPFEPAV